MLIAVTGRTTREEIAKATTAGFDAVLVKHRLGSGVGVGLAVVRQLVVLHQGRIELISAPGHGAQFVVRLPIAGPTRHTGAETA